MFCCSNKKVKKVKIKGDPEDETTDPDLPIDADEDADEDDDNEMSEITKVKQTNFEHTYSYLIFEYMFELLSEVGSTNRFIEPVISEVLEFDIWKDNKPIY